MVWYCAQLPHLTPEIKHCAVFSHQCGPFRRDMTFTSDGMILHVHSTKIVQYHECVPQIPVLSIAGSPLCAVTFLKEHFSKFPGGLDDLLLYKDTLKGRVGSV